MRDGQGRHKVTRQLRSGGQIGANRLRDVLIAEVGQTPNCQTSGIVYQNIQTVLDRGHNICTP
ncbi:MAG: hypothetical protein VW891_18885, partial [Novosphingobium sp.]